MAPRQQQHAQVSIANTASHAFTAPDGVSTCPAGAGACAAATPGLWTGNPDGSRYIQMTIELTVEDRAGNRTTAVRRAVKLYPNQLCGFSY